MKTWVGRSFALLLAITAAACTGERDSEDQESKLPDAAQVNRSDTDPGQPAVPFPADNVKTAASASTRTVNGREPVSAEELLEKLASLARNDAGLVEPVRQEWLRQLKSMGAHAVIPIRDFLLDTNGESEKLAELRRALLGVALGIDSAAMEGVALELLASGLPVGEIRMLAQYLETRKPGEHVEAILDASEQYLLASDLLAELPADLYQLLGQFGNEDTALLLQEVRSQSDAYATMALAAMPEGAGLPGLIQQASVFHSGQDTVQGRLAIQLLAQTAPQEPQAAAALIELARGDAIPPDIWPYVLDILAGNWALTFNRPTTGLAGSHTYYQPDGEQTIYRVDLPQAGIQAGFDAERVLLLDTLQPLAPPELGAN